MYDIRTYKNNEVAMGTKTPSNKMAANMAYRVQSLLSWMFSGVILLLCIDLTMSARSRYSGSRYTRYRSTSYRSSYYASRYRSYGGSYYFMYSSYRSRTSRTSSSSGSTVCKNYEKNDNGTYLGLFVCPLPFEPSDYSSCCGSTNKEYCCQPGMSTGAIIAVCIVLISLAVIIGSAMAYYQFRKNKRKVAQGPQPRTTQPQRPPVRQSGPGRAQPAFNISQNVRFRNPPGNQQNFMGPPQGYPPSHMAPPPYSSPIPPSKGGMPYPNTPPPEYGMQQQVVTHGGGGAPYPPTETGGMPAPPPSYQAVIHDTSRYHSGGNP